MTDYAKLFHDAWDEEVAKRREQSPSFQPEEYVATGRATKEYGGKRNIAWWLDNGPGMVEAYANWRENVGWDLLDIAGQPAVELALLFELPGLELPIRGYIDRVFVLPTGEVAVVDIKTGREPETPEQLGLYRVGLGIVHGIWPSWGYFWSPDKGHGQPHDLEMYTPELFSMMFNEAINGINAGSFLPKPANACRNWCGVARFCHAVGGSEASGHDPLAPVLTIATKEG